MGQLVKIGESTAPRSFQTASPVTLPTANEKAGQVIQSATGNGKLIKIGEATAPKSFQTTAVTEPPTLETLPILSRSILEGKADPAFVLRANQAKRATETSQILTSRLIDVDASIGSLTEELSKINNGTAIYTQEGKTRAAQIEQELASLRKRAQELETSPDLNYEDYLSTKYDGKSGLYKAAAGIGHTFTSSPAVIKETVKTGIDNATSKDPAVLEANARISELNEELSHINNGTAIYTPEGKARAAEIEAEITRLSAEAAGKAADMNSSAMRQMQEANWLQNEATKNIENPVGKFFANTGMSIAQNAVLLPTAVINPALPLAAMGSIAGAQKMYEVSAEGKSAGEALGRGLVSGGIEALTEKLPLDSLADLVKTGGKSALKNLLKQSGVEATEEGLSYAMNYIADKLAKDPEATWDWADFANNVASGGVSGLFFGLGGTAINRVSNSSLNSNGVFPPGSGLDTPVQTQQTAQNSTTTPTQPATAPNVTAPTQGTTAQNAAPGAVQTQNKTAPTGETEVSLVQRIQKAIPQMQGAAPVATVTGNELPQGSRIVDRLTQFVNAIGNKVNRPGFGDVLFSRGKIKSSMIGHGVGDAKIETFAAVPAVIQNGQQIDYQQNWKGRSYDTYTFMAPVTYRGARTYLGVIVQKDSTSNRYYLHEVVDENGAVIYKNNEAPAAASDGTSALAGDLDTVADTGTDQIIPQAAQEVNGRAAAQSDMTPTEARVDEIYNELAKGKRKVNGYTVYINRDSQSDGATITVKQPDGSNVKKRIDGGRYFTKEQLNYSAATLVAELTQAQTGAALKLDENGNPIGPESSVGAATAGFDPYSNMISEYGVIPEGENPARVVDVPKSTNGKDRVSYTARTVMEAKATPDSAMNDLGEAVLNGELSYIPITNKETAAHAETEIERKGFATALADWTAEVRQGKSSASLTAMGATLYNNAINSGDAKTAMSILVDYAASLRSGAQAVQAARILKTLSPDNKLYVIEGTVEALNRRFFDDSGQVGSGHGRGSTGGVTQAEGEISKAVQDQLDTAYSLIENIYKAFQDEGKHGVPVENWMSEVGKLLAGDIARKVSGSTRSTSEPITKTIQKDLLRFARSYLPESSRQSSQSKRTAADTIRDYFNNRENYAKAWNAAKDAYRAKNGWNQQLMDAAEEWLNGTISYSGDGSDAVILQAIVDTAIDADMTLKDIVTRADLGDLHGVEQELFQRLNAEVGATGADSQALELAVQRHLTEAVQNAEKSQNERIDNNIKNILKDAGLKMSEIIQQNRADKEAAGKKIADMLIQEYGVSQDAAETAASIVTERFDSMVKEAAHKKLDSIFKERKKPMKKTDRQRLEQFANLGAFESEYNAQAAEKATGYRIEIDQALADEFVNAKTDEARDAALDKIIQNIADQVPSGLMEKFNAFRYVNMLGNLKTQVRNVVGNTTMMVMRTAKDRIAAGIEAAVYKASGGKFERTKAFVYDPALYKAAWGDFKNVQKLALGEQKYAVTSGGSGEIMNEINDRRTIFKNNGTWGTRPEELPITRLVRKATDAAWKLPEAYREITNWAMEQGDVIFSRANYTDALAQYLTAHKVTAEQMNAGTVDPELLDNARAYAIREAQRATFRDTNALSKAISEIGFKNADSVPKKLMNTAVQGRLPFRKTPANVLVRMEEYSPLGFANTAINGVRLALGSENVTGADVVDSLAKSLTGGMLWALGLALYHAGRLVVGHDDDDEQAALDALTGGQTYAYVDADGNSYTLDWLSPAASPMFMAAEFAQLGEQNGISFWDLWEAAKTITTPMLEMSMLQGLNDALEDVGYSEDPLIDLMLGGVLDYMTQGLTTTLMSQAERTSDDVRMTTFTDKTSDTPAEVQYNIGYNSAKVPGWDYQQIPYIDAWGRQQEYASLPVRALENFVLPFYTSSKNETEADKEIQRLLDVGQTGVVPDRVSQSVQVTYKESPDNEESQKRYLAADEYVEYATIKGQTSYDIVCAMIDSDFYKSLTDEQKADAIKLAYTYAGHLAAEEVTDGKHESERYVELAQAAKKELGLSEAEYLLLYKEYGGTAVNGDKVREAYQAGMDPVDYLEYYAGKSAYNEDGIGSLTIAENAEAIQNSGLSQDQQEIMWLLTYPDWAEAAEKKGVSNSEYIQYKVATYGCTKDADKRAALVAAGFSEAEARTLVNKIG